MNWIGNWLQYGLIKNEIKLSFRINTLWFYDMMYVLRDIVWYLILDNETRTVFIQENFLIELLRSVTKGNWNIDKCQKKYTVLLYTNDPSRG